MKISQNTTTYGIIIMITSSIIFSVMAVLVRLTQGTNSFTISFFRFLTGTTIIMTLRVSGIIHFRIVKWRLLLVRGVFGAISVSLFYLSIIKIGLGKGTLLSYLYPIFAALLAPLLIKEKFRVDIIIVTIIALMGVYLIINPSTITSVSIYEVLALIGALCAGIAIISVRKLQETESSFTIFLAQCMCGIVIAVVPGVNAGLDFTTITWIILITIGITATIGQLLMTYAYRYVPATEGSLLNFLVPVFNIILSILIFKEKLTIPTTVGTIVVIICCAYIAFRDKIIRRITHSPV